MTVYLSGPQYHGRVGRRVAVWAHLTADSREELAAFASKLGLSERWWRARCTMPASVCGPCPHWWWLVPDSRRPDLRAAGAVEVDNTGWTALIAGRRDTAETAEVDGAR